MNVILFGLKGLSLKRFNFLRSVKRNEENCTFLNLCDDNLIDAKQMAQRAGEKLNELHALFCE